MYNSGLKVCNSGLKVCNSGLKVCNSGLKVPLVRILKLIRTYAKFLFVSFTQK